jgi:hypothetical protein
MHKLNTMFFALVAFIILAFAAIAYLLIVHYDSQNQCQITPQTVAKSDGKLCARP